MINAIIKQLESTRAFGVPFEFKKVKVGLYKVLYRKGILKSEVTLERAFDVKNAAILAYLRKKYAHIINRYRQLDSKTTTDNIIKNRIIWTCWFQGEENAPEIVKRSIASIRRHSGNAKVVVITFKNLHQYISIPDVIQAKWKHGIISDTLFSDYLRFKVLHQYGGLWLDATCYCVRSIPEEVFSIPTYAPRNITDFIYKGVGSYQFFKLNEWTSYCVAGQLNSVFISATLDMLEDYMEHETSLIAYLLIFYIAYIVRTDVPMASAEYKKIPENNKSTEILGLCLNLDSQDSMVKRVLADETTWFFKLSYKRPLSNKPNTVFNKLLVKA